MSASPAQNGGKPTPIAAPVAGDHDETDSDSSSVTSDSDSDDLADDQSEAIASAEDVHTTYRKVLSRRVDLVGDYAGDELFVIEGDSMLRRCFDDDKLDFDPGCQILHAVYNVESFLHSLHKRKCNFRIVFFDSNRQACLPPKAAEQNAARYFLARAVIIRHLKTSVQKAHPELQVDVFPSWNSPDFSEYLVKVSPYFLMAHDGAEAADRKGDFLRDDANPATTSRADLRHMILSFMSRGFNVALVNGLECRDTKVMTMVLEPKHRSASYARFLKSNHDEELSGLPTIDVSAELKSLEGTDLTERQALTVITVAKLLQDESADVQLCAPLLLHQALLAELPLSARRIEAPTSDIDVQKFIGQVASHAEGILNGASWQTSQLSVVDIEDALDGRLFLSVLCKKPTVTPTTHAVLQRLIAAVQTIAQANVPEDYAAKGTSSEHATTSTPVPERKKAVRVLPFSNNVFDKHLESIHLKIDSTPEGPSSLAARKVFQEVTHWHNYKKPLVKKVALTPEQTRAEAKNKFWVDRRNQWFMAEMRTYAASLTNAVGRSLDPETIIAGIPRSSKPSAPSPPPSVVESEVSDSGSSTKGKGKPGAKKGGGGGKAATKNAAKQAMLNQIAATKAKKDGSATDKIMSAWQVTCKGIEADSDPRSRYRKAKTYLTNLQPSWYEVIATECELYLLNCLLVYWIDGCRRGEQQRRLQTAALIWSHARTIAKQPLSKTIAKCLNSTKSALQLPPLPALNETQVDRKLAFTFALPTNVENLAVTLPSKEFQLVECGPYLERSFDSKPDPRVEFQPDGWQRKVLDTIDADQSVFVVAPTSAGKTFISFYAMRKVLEADDDGVLVYVAPTKALVNQIAAEVQARYSKRFKYGGKSVWGIHTRDYRINSATGCQVLVTVPHVLQIMLMAPSHATSWSTRVRRIIFDEIHSIGQAEDGVVWEQLLLMAPCPIVALSATVGNPEEFSGWLSTTQQAIGKDLVTVNHPFRYSDLRKYFYVPPQKFVFTGIPEKTTFGSLGLEGLTGFNFVHPVAGLVDKARGIPVDLALEPRDCLALWKAMTKVQTDDFPISAKLDPSKALPDVSRKVDILEWERSLKVVLAEWLSDSNSPYDKLVQELETSFRDEQREETYTTVPGTTLKSSVIKDPEDLFKTTLPLLCRLHSQDALPAILFNFDRHMCENICRTVVEQMAAAEATQVKETEKWARTLEQFEKHKALKEKAAAKKGPAKKVKLNDADDGASKLDLQRDAADEGSKWDSFDPDAPIDGYHFADYTKVLRSEFEVYIRQLRRRDIAPWLIDSLMRGVGVHHAGMNRKYRQVVEILFRKRFLCVVISTGTLALGINMPCKTVVFSGDSVFLTALNYRQCAGRAGRRGFDLLGNVVFQGVSRQKVCRLLSSRLPDLNGHFPITTTLVLRLFTLLHESKGAKYAVSAINALLSQPRLYMGGPSFKDQTMHHLRFSIEYLRRQQLLGSDGAPLNFAGLVSHLYFTENSAFAFHALLKEGFFHELCSNVDNDEKNTLETLMLVMAHLFNRVQCRQADEEYRRSVVKPSSSLVFLPPLPKQASDILVDHNKQTLAVYRGYVETFVDQHVKHEDRTLPLSGINAGADGGSESASIDSLPATRVRSSFVALSGAGDDFDNIHDLCQTIRDGVFLEEAVVPHMEIYPQESELPLNAYLLDFFKHGDINTIEKANRVRKADIWFLLNDFSLVLATIITSLMNFMKLIEASDLDMLEVMGNLDAHEEAEDDKVAAVEGISSSGESSAPSMADSGVVITDRTKPAASARNAVPTNKQSRKAETWEDLAGSSDDDDDEAVITANKQLGGEAEELAEMLGFNAWDGEGGEGLKQVLKAFQKLHAEFGVKFKAMWA